MHDYKLMEDDNTTLLFNSCFVDDEDIEYAYKHRFDILYTETSACDTFKLIKKLMDLGYTLEVIEKPVTYQGLQLDPKLYAKFIHPDNSNINITDIEEKDRNEKVKLRYIVDIDIDEEDTEMEIVLRDDIKDYVENHEYGYTANSVDVKIQDEYCIKEEQRVLKAGRKALLRKMDLEEG